MFSGYKEISLDEPVKLESDDIQILLTENDQDIVQTPENPTEAEEGGFHIDNFGDEAPIVVEEPPADGQFILCSILRIFTIF